jgi:Ca-activated chloride channel family protein
MKQQLSLLGLAALLPLLLGVDLLQSRNKAVEDGNAQLKAGKPVEALARYDEAAGKLAGEPGVHFNRGAALYGLSRWEDAAAAFLRATEARTPPMKAAAFYNLGNSFFQAKKYGEAVEAFKKSLAYDPADVKAKWNLELALRQKQEQDKKQQDDKNKDGKDDKSKKDKSDKDANNDKKGEEQNQDQNRAQKKPEDRQAKNDSQQPKPDNKDGKQDDKQQPPKPPEPDKPSPAQQAKQDPNKPPEGHKPPEAQEVEAILDNLERSPKALEQELARIRALNRRPPAKDW